MARTPPAGPHFRITIDGKTYTGVFEQRVWDHILAEQRLNETNIGSLVSGNAQAQATAEAALVVAQAAAANAETAVTSPTFYLTADSYYAVATLSAPGPMETSPVTVSITGGTGPFSQAWTKVDGDTIPPTFPTALTTAFALPTLGSGQIVGATYRITVTDSLLNTATLDVGVAASCIVISGELPP